MATSPEENDPIRAAMEKVLNPAPVEPPPPPPPPEPPLKLSKWEFVIRAAINSGLFVAVYLMLAIAYFEFREKPYEIWILVGFWPVAVGCWCLVARYFFWPDYRRKMGLE